MKFKRYIEGNFIKREKRFFVHYESVNGSIEIAYCANTGKMADILKVGNNCIFTPYEGKMQYKWEMTFCQKFKSFVGTNTQNPNKILMEAIEEKRIPYFAEENNFKQEVSFKI